MSKITREKNKRYNDTPSHLKGNTMSVKAFIEKLTSNKKNLVKTSLIVTGTVAGIALAAGLVVKNKKALGDALETVTDAVDNVTAK
jgi:citrate lyase synthetase